MSSLADRDTCGNLIEVTNLIANSVKVDVVTDDDQFPVNDTEWWERVGKHIAYRNLYISIPCLLLGFATWAMWSMITVKMKNTGYNFGVADLTEKELKSYLYTITGTAGLSGATFRLVHSFMIRVGGGRNVIFLTTGLLLIPCIFAGILLLNQEADIKWWILGASFAGFGGGNLSSSISNINNFFPKSSIGTALGLNAGLGNVGVFTALLFVSLAVSWNIGLSDGHTLTKEDTTIIGTNGVGQLLYPENGAFVWVPMLLVLTCLAGKYMTNLEHVSPGSTTDYLAAYIKILQLKLFAWAGVAVGIVTIMLSLMGGFWSVLPFLVLPLVIIIPIQLLKRFAPKEIKPDITRQFAILSNKHTWIMSVIYTMTFGSFIGFSFAFPLLIDNLFEELPDGSPNPDAPSPAIFAPPGPLLGALVRPLGGWLSDKMGSGSRVTTLSTLMIIVTTVIIAICIVLAREAENPTDYFMLFYLSFLGLFFATGIGNGSTFRSVPYIFDKSQAGPVLGFTAAIAAYGSFVIPQLFKTTIEGGKAEIACWIFVAYYLVCLALNYWYYERKGSGILC